MVGDCLRESEVGDESWSLTDSSEEDSPLLKEMGDSSNSQYPRTIENPPSSDLLELPLGGALGHIESWFRATPPKPRTKVFLDAQINCYIVVRARQRVFTTHLYRCQNKWGIGSVK